MPQGLPTELQGLLSPEAYPHAVTTVELIQTHISWVLLTGEYAYKIARPVRYAFIDLTDPRRRAQLCEDALQLNRRFAPGIYLDICDVVQRGGGACMGGPGAVIARALRMRQFPTGDVLDHLLEADAIEPDALRRFGHGLADVHAGLPVAREHDAAAQPSRVAEAVRENFRQTCAVLSASAGRLAVIGRGLDARLDQAVTVIARRCAGGMIRECHGDLHAGNIVRLGAELQAFDCLEFDEALRWIDVAAELAFLYVDLSARRRPLHANAFLNGYLERGGDYGSCSVLGLYSAHRALIRAKVLALSQVPTAGLEGWLRTAEEALAPKRPRLILMTGYSGSGKTWLARRLAPLCDAVHLRSDVERRRLGGLAGDASSRSTPGEGIYTPDHNFAVYERLERCADWTLAGGLTVIVDAAFLSRADRARFKALASRHGLKACVLRVQAPRDVLLRRLAERAARGSDASEADAAVLDWQRSNAEPLQPDEGFDSVDVDSPGLSTPVIGALASRLAGAAI